MKKFCLYFVRNFYGMIECIEDIKTKIETVKSKTDNSLIDEVAINQYLDAILVFQKRIDGIVIDIDALVEDLYEFFHKNPSQEFFLKLKPNLDALYKTASKCYIRARKSKYYAGAKTSIKEFRLCIVGLHEIIHDLELFLITLPNNERFQKLAEKIDEIFA